MKDRIALSVFWIVWSRGGIQTLSALSTLLVARWLDPSDYGVMAIAGVWTATISLLTELGMGTAIIQFRDLDQPELNACFWFNNLLAWAGYFILFFAAPSIALWFDSPRVSDVMRVLALSLPIFAIRIVPEGLLRKALAFDQISKAGILSALMTLPSVLGLAWAGWGVWALVAGSLIPSVISTIVILWMVKWLPGVKVQGRRVAEIFRYSLTTLGSRLCWSLYHQADAFVLGKVGGDTVLGFYAMAKELAMLPVNKITSVVNQLAHPIMAEFQDDSQALRKSLMKGTRLVSCVTFPISVGVILVAPDVIPLALTEKWTPIVPILQVLCLFAVIKSIDALLPTVFQARYRPNFLFAYTGTLLVIMPIVFWVGATHWGGMGVAIGWVAVYPLIMLTMAKEALHEIGLSQKHYWEQLRVPMVATLVMVGGVLSVQTLLDSAGLVVGWIRIILSCTTGVTVYGGVLYVFGTQLTEEILEVVSWVLRPKKQAISGEKV